MATASGLLHSQTGETANLELSQPAAPLAPYLILIGSAAREDRPARGRLVPIGRGLEAGRGRPKSGRGVRFLALADPSVSSSHARLVVTPGGIELMDLQSRNGTFVDGVAVKRRRLADGAVVFFGGCAAVYRRASGDAVAAIETDLRDPFGPVPTASPAMAVALWLAAV